VKIKTFENIEKLNIFAAEKFIEIANDSIAERGLFTVALSGGSTPKKLYALLATEPFRSQIDWKKVFFFFGDERDVPFDSDESNFKMANETLFKPLNISSDNIYQWRTDYRIPERIAESYETYLTYFFRGNVVFDLVLLGMGTDGHTASLFPHTEALDISHKFAYENWVEKLKDWRFTFTFPTINNARNIIFLIAGQDKAETLREVLHGEFQPEKLPSQAVKPINGELWFLTDIKID
jgi:6-phosphogluconolactonase